MPMLNIDLLFYPVKNRPTGEAFLGTARRRKQGVKT
jgi:hypothetical protein